MQPGDIISYLQMCSAEGTSLQRGMNYQLRGKHSVILMSTRASAPYNDRVLDDGKVLIYEGHDQPRSELNPDPKIIDQVLESENGSKTQNGRFFISAQEYLKGGSPADIVRVYEKIYQGIWVYNGNFMLVDAWPEVVGGRTVYKFKLELTEDSAVADRRHGELEHTRIIPASVKLAVWERDNGKCIECGAAKNLHFDHIIPYSRGGSSLVAENIQLLCAKHNLSKHDKIM